MSSAGPPSVVGKSCPYCMTKIEPGVATVVCPQCGIPHHADCWRENGRCTTFGCQGGGPSSPPRDQCKATCATCRTAPAPSADS